MFFSSWYLASSFPSHLCTPPQVGRCTAEPPYESWPVTPATRCTFLQELPWRLKPQAPVPGRNLWGSSQPGHTAVLLALGQPAQDARGAEGEFWQGPGVETLGYLSFCGTGLDSVCVWLLSLASKTLPASLPLYVLEIPSWQRLDHKMPSCGF